MNFQQELKEASKKCSSASNYFVNHSFIQNKATRKRKAKKNFLPTKPHASCVQ